MKFLAGKQTSWILGEHGGCYLTACPRPVTDASVFRRLEEWLVVILLVTLIGGHWAILQSIAWTRMLLDYSHTASITEAWTKTFDGKHPCKMCKFVRAGKATEKKQEMLNFEVKLDLKLDAGGFSLFPPTPCRHFTPRAERAEFRPDTPILPPPKPA